MRLPNLTLTAAGSRRDVNLSRLGAPVVLVLHGQNTAKAAFEVNAAVREVHPDPRKVVIASIIDLRSFPSMFHGMVKPELEKAYLKAAANLDAGINPHDAVILLPDWDGKAHDALGVVDTTSVAAILVADAAGNVLGTKQGEDLGKGALAFLAGQGS